MSRYRSIPCYVIAVVVFACVCNDVCLAQRDRFETSGPSPVPNAGSADTCSRRARFPAQAASGKPYLGVEIKDTSRRSRTRGALVEAVNQGSPAEKAGVTKGGIITSLDRKPVTSAAQVTELVAGLKIGVDYPITVVRDSSTINLTIRPEALPASNANDIADAPRPEKGRSISTR